MIRLLFATFFNAARYYLRRTKGETTVKQQTLAAYTPNYPKKLLKGAALTAAAMLTLSPALACRTAPQISGAIAIDEPTEEAVRTDGEVMIDEPTDVPMTTGLLLVPEPTPEELVLDGDVMIDPNLP